MGGGSFLRKKKYPSQKDAAQPQVPASSSGSSSKPTTQQLRPSLSLPDLTTPLIDPGQWEEIPSFAVPSLPTDPNGRGHRKPSLVARKDPKTGSPVGFHRPFTPLLVRGPKTEREDEGNTGGSGGEGGVRGSKGGGDFRVSRSGWAEAASGGGERMSTATGESVLNRGKSRSRGQTEGKGIGKGKGKGRGMERMNVVVVGGKGVGKTR